MKKHICIILLAALLLLCACQPTPEEPVVIGKDNEAMIEKAKETSVPVSTGSDLWEQLGCPEVYSVSFTDETKKINITGEAPILLPDAEGLPLLFVEADRFSQDTVTAFFNRLCGDVTMYEYPTETPKYAIQNQMEQTMQEIETLREKGVPDDDGELAWRLRDMENLQKALVDAPDEVELISSDGTLHRAEMTFQGKQRGTTDALSVLSEPFTSNGGRHFSVYNDADYTNDGVDTFVDEQGNVQGFNPQSGSRLTYVREGGDLLGSYASGTPIWDVTRESESDEPAVFPDITIHGWNEPETLLLSVTPKSAREQAEALLKECGVTDMRFDSIALYTNRQPVSPEWQDAEEAYASYSPEQQAYSVRFLREVKGVPVEGYFGSSQSAIDGMEYGREWSYEVLEIAVDDGGIRSVEWVGPLKSAEIETDRAALLPFSEIDAIFRKMLPIKYFNINSDIDFSIRIDRVRLCLWRIIDKDSYTRGILAPVWCFYGSVNSRETERQPLLIINAVDGSVIDPQQGY